jgi:hypothetical protein
MNSGAIRVSLEFRGDWYTELMTLVEITYELQAPLTNDQLSHLGQFANTYGLRSFKVNEAGNQLSFEYDASRLRETQVGHVLAQAHIAVTRKVN